MDELRIQKFVSEGTPSDVVARYAVLPELAKNSDFGEFDRNIVVLDTETTGVSLRKDELTQIAAARIENGEITDWYVTFVNPGKPIPEDVSHLTNITDEDVADALTPEEALEGLVNFVGGSDAKLVAHNAAFDRNFTTKHPAGYPLLKNTWIDSLELARIALPRMKGHRLIDLVKAFDAPLSTHRADEDVAATCALYRILLAAVSAMPKPLVRQIALLAPKTEWPTQTVFAYFAEQWIREELGSSETLDKPNSAENSEDVENFESKAGLSEKENGQAPKKLTPFSLRSMRHERMRNVEKPQPRPKRDAATMVSSELAQKAGLRLSRNEADAEGTNELSTLSFPTREVINKAFSPEGVVGRIYGDFQPREEQLEMAQAVRQAFATSDNLMVEAGTGVGKSMAYLVPAALSARENNISIGIATKTNALLDQLIYQELPALAEELEAEHPASKNNKLTFASIKGFSNYLCLRKVGRVASEGARIKTVQNEEKTNAPAIASALSFIEQTEYDDMQHLKVDYRLLPRRQISTTSHECMRRKCPFYGTMCFVHGQRRRAEYADIVVTNHSLLFCDIAADNGLLPPIRYWVVDEAHGAQNEARRALSLEINIDDLNQLTRRIASDEARENVFLRAERNVAMPSDAAVNSSTEQAKNAAEFGTLFFGLTNKAKLAGKTFAEAEGEFATHVRDLLFFDTQKKSSYEYADIWINDATRESQTFQALAGHARKLIEAAEREINAAQDLVALLEGIADSETSAGTVQREIATVALELKDLVQAAHTIFIEGSAEYVYSATLARKADRPGNALHAQLYNVGERLNETLYTNTHSVVFTSATLTVDGSFRPFEEAMGLNTSEQSRTQKLLLRSSYDFDNQMKVYVASDLPDPREPDYIPALQQLLRELHIAQGGSMLTLFTNRQEMERIYAEVLPALKEHDLRLVCQKWGVSTKGLRDDFLADETLSLFALKSFWEGFDAPGDTLRGVVISKLPFTSPSDPLSREREARDPAAWRNYSLPQAVLEVKQAAGRLIRKSTDTGVLVLTDSRLVTKNYGRVFLNSLPSKNIHVMPAAQIIECIRAERAAE